MSPSAEFKDYDAVRSSGISKQSSMGSTELKNQGPQVKPFGEFVLAMSQAKSQGSQDQKNKIYAQQNLPA